VSRRGCSLPALLAPFFSQLVAAGDAVVDPLHFPLKGGGQLREHGFLEIADRVRQVSGHDGVRKVSNLAQTVTNRIRHVIRTASGFLHDTSSGRNSNTICFTVARCLQVPGIPFRAILSISAQKRSNSPSVV